MEFNNSCYKLKTLNFESGIFDDCVDITYIITMDTSIERHKNIIKQLSKVAPTKKVVIVYNKGFRKCPKYHLNKKIDISVEDITYSHLFIYKHAKKYNNILVFEDDFMLNEKNLTKKAINEINNFVNNKNPNIYYLGCITFFLNLLYLNATHKKTLFEVGLHAYIINKSSRNYLLKRYFNNKFVFPDLDTETIFVKNKFFYYKPLYIQPFIETENQKNWGKNDNNNIIIKKIIEIFQGVGGLFLLKYVLKLNKLENLKENWNKAYKKIFLINLIGQLLIVILFIIIVKKLI